MQILFGFAVVFSIASLIPTATASAIAYGQCANVWSDVQCNQLASAGECWLQPLRNCVCSKSCNSRPYCPDLSVDNDCACLVMASSCNTISSRALCPTTCARRDVVVCNVLPDVPHATPSMTLPLYGDKISYTCDAGYQRVDGDQGLRVCITGGGWVVSTTNGTPPVCQAIDCGPPLKIKNYVPSLETGVYGDVVTYACDAAAMQLGGGLAQHTCGSSGAWVVDSSDNHPICADGEHYFTTSVTEIDPAAVPSLTLTSSRSDLDCARACSVAPPCEGYTFNRTTFVCSINGGPQLPVVTQMKRLYTDT